MMQTILRNPLTRRFAMTLLAAGLAMLPACSTPPKGSSASTQPDRYRTVPKDPKRDSETAERENARAAKLIEQKKWEQAEKALKVALEADVTFGPAHNNLGKVYYHQDKLYLAAWEFEYAIKLLPGQPEPRNNLGLVFEAVGKLDDAVEWYAKARDMAVDNPQFLGNLARARTRRGDKDEEVRKLLSEVMLKDTRPEWVRWARERLALYGSGTVSKEAQSQPQR